jgi:hypothetical protein
MRGAMLTLLLFVAAGARAAPAELPDWLAGTWRSESETMLVEERWSTPHAGLMLGTSRTYIGGKKAFFEFLRIETRDDGVYYVAQPRGGPPTAFKRTARTDRSLTFENREHDYPQRIRYRLERDGSLVATIDGPVEGEPREESWHYRRSNAP